MKKKAEVLPKTANEINNGGLYLQRIKCGKSNCRCARGELHTAYYFFARVNGKLTKKHVPKNQVEQISALIEQSRERRLEERRNRPNNRELLKMLRAALRTKRAYLRQRGGNSLGTYLRAIHKGADNKEQNIDILLLSYFLG